VRYRFVNTVVVVGVQDAESLQSRLDDHILMIRDQWSIHGDLDLLAPSDKLPAIDLATAGKAPVDTGMAVQIGRRPRLAASCKIVGRSDGEHPYICGEAHSNHVLLEALTDTNARIESARDDVAQAIVDHDIEHDVGCAR